MNAIDANTFLPHLVLFCCYVVCTCPPSVYLHNNYSQPRCKIPNPVFILSLIKQKNTLIQTFPVINNNLSNCLHPSLKYLHKLTFKTCPAARTSIHHFTNSFQLLRISSAVFMCHTLWAHKPDVFVCLFVFC